MRHAGVRLPLPQLLLKAGLRARFSDARCGFKAVRTDVFRVTSPAVLSTGANTHLEYAS